MHHQFLGTSVRLERTILFHSRGTGTEVQRGGCSLKKVAGRFLETSMTRSRKRRWTGEQKNNVRVVISPIGDLKK